MDLADVFNTRGLFQQLGGWISVMNNVAKRHARLVLQRAYQALFHIDQSVRLEERARLQFNRHAKMLESLPSELQGWSPTVVKLIIELSGALGALRVLQNDIWMLVVNANGVKDTPSSMRDVYKAISRKNNSETDRPRWLNEVDASVKQHIEKYWSNSGEVVATYRDVDQHHDALARGCFLLTKNNSVTRVSVRLPDNPECKSRSKFKYDSRIDALEFAQKAFSSLHQLVEDLARIHHPTPALLQRTIVCSPPTRHKVGVAQTTGIILFDFKGHNGLVMEQDKESHVRVRLLGMRLRKEK